MKQNETYPFKNIEEVPQDPGIRVKIHQKILMKFQKLTVPFLGEDELIKNANEILESLALPLKYRLYTMVEIHNAISWPLFIEVPYHERLLLLPHCLRQEPLCEGHLNQGLLECAGCGRCIIDKLQDKAKALGYNVLISEDASSVLEVIMMTGARAVLGVSCLKTLWKVFPWVAQFGLYGHAIPLLKDGCKNTEVDEERVFKSLDSIVSTPTSKVTQSEQRENLFQPLFSKMMSFLGEPQDDTESISYNWVLCGGKRVRSFLVISIYTLLTKNREIPENVLQVALAIELFHKASLIHDDIEDQETSRYGQPPLYKQYSIPIAINIGDYLVGRGYQLLSSASLTLGHEKGLKITRIFSQFHTQITRGQGRELLWSHRKEKEIDLPGIEEIYAFKTSLFFEIAAVLGLILAGRDDLNNEALSRFITNMGIAYQIIDDIGDYQSEIQDSESAVRNDICSTKPTILYALSLNHASPEDRARLIGIYRQDERKAEDIDEVLNIFERSKALELAQEIYKEYYNKARESLESILEPSLKRLLGDLLEYRIARKFPGPK